MIANAIEGYYALLDQNDKQYRYCIEKSKKLSKLQNKFSTDDALVLLKLAIDDSRMLVRECQMHVDTIWMNPRNLSAISNAISFINATCLMSTKEVRTSLVNILCKSVKKLLLMLVKNSDYMNEITDIIAFVLTHVSHEDILRDITIWQEEKFQDKVKFIYYIKRAYAKALCKYISNCTLIVPNKLTLLNKLPYECLNFLDQNYIVHSFRHIFQDFSIEDLNSYCGETLKPLLLNNDFGSLLVENFGVALSSLNSPHILFLVVAILTPEVILYSSTLEYFLAELIIVLPENEQIHLLKQKILPMLTMQNKIRAFAVRLLAKLGSKSSPGISKIFINCPAPFKSQNDQFFLPHRTQITFSPVIKYLTTEYFAAPHIAKNFFYSISHEIIKYDNRSKKYLLPGLLALILTYSENDNSLLLEIIPSIFNIFSNQFSDALNEKHRLILPIEIESEHAIFFGLLFKYINNMHAPESLWSLFYNVILDSYNQQTSAICLSEMILKQTEEMKKKQLGTLVEGLNFRANVDEMGANIVTSQKHRKMLFERDMLAVCFAYQNDPSLDGLHIFLEKCFELYSSSNKFIQSTAKTVLQLLSSVAPGSYRLRILKEVKFSCFMNEEGNRLFKLITALKGEESEIALDIMINHFKMLNRFSNEVFNILPMSETKQLLIHKIYNDPVNCSETRLMTYAFWHYKISASNEKLFALVIKFLTNPNDVLSQDCALEILLYFSNSLQLSKQFDLIISFTKNPKLSAVAFSVIAKMLGHLSQSQLDSLENFIRAFGDLTLPNATINNVRSTANLSVFLAAAKYLPEYLDTWESYHLVDPFLCDELGNSPIHYFIEKVGNKLTVNRLKHFFRRLFDNTADRIAILELENQNGITPTDLLPNSIRYNRNYDEFTSVAIQSVGPMHPRQLASGNFTESTISVEKTNQEARSSIAPTIEMAQKQPSYTGTFFELKKEQVASTNLFKQKLQELIGSIDDYIGLAKVLPHLIPRALSLKEFFVLIIKNVQGSLQPNELTTLLQISISVLIAHFNSIQNRTRLSIRLGRAIIKLGEELVPLLRLKGEDTQFSEKNTDEIELKLVETAINRIFSGEKLLNLLSQSSRFQNIVSQLKDINVREATLYASAGVSQIELDICNQSLNEVILSFLHSSNATENLTPSAKRY